MSGNNAAMREALLAAGIGQGKRKQRFNTFRDYFAHTDVSALLKSSGMPVSKQIKLEDIQNTEQILDFANLTRDRLYQANSTISLQTNYISLLESLLLRNGIQLPTGTKKVNTSEATNMPEVSDETERNQSC